MQTDPIGVAGGINLYAYVGGDPVNLVDPFGFDKTCTGSRIRRPDDFDCGTLPGAACTGNCSGFHGHKFAPVGRGNSGGSRRGPRVCQTGETTKWGCM